MSLFPLGFRGCYNCGETTHFCAQYFPTANYGSFEKIKFFSEIWAHKPHKKNEEAREGRSSQIGSAHVINCYQNNDHNHNSSNNFTNSNNGPQIPNSAQRGGDNRNNGPQTHNSA